MIAHSSEPSVPDRPRWVAEIPQWKKLPVDLGMRAAGRIGVGLNGLLGSRARDRLGILMYHRVAPFVAGLPAPLHNVRPKSFAAQLEGLIQRGFQFVSLRQALHAADHGEPLPPRSVVVTFDDGFASVYTQAWPVMKRLGVPATVFLNTAYLDTDEPFPFDAWGVAHRDRAPLESVRPLRTEECREMMQSGLIEIGAHTHTHEDFRGRPDSFREDLSLSVQIVRERFGVDDVTFAFPYGSEHAGFASDELCHAARAADVCCGLTTKPDVVTLSDSPFRWGRFNVFAWDTSATLAAKLGGWYGWAPGAKLSIARMVRRLKPSRSSGHGAKARVLGEKSL